MVSTASLFFIIAHLIFKKETNDEPRSSKGQRRKMREVLKILYSPVGILADRKRTAGYKGSQKGNL
jgi:hypothetical protein